MKYVAIRVAKNTKGNYVVQGQKNTDYNWETLDMLVVMDFLPAANDLAISVAKSLSRAYGCYIPAYGLGGYGIGAFYKGEVHNN